MREQAGSERSREGSPAPKGLRERPQLCPGFRDPSRRRRVAPLAPL